ncbi:MAG TPA: ABC transporter permease [Thermoanaerobaculia bacterium]|nr:ABC transporter permease [Thermoanaerobaculia bacterium]
MSRVVIEETIRRHVTNIAYITYVALLAIIGVGVSRFGSTGAGWPTFVALLSIIIGCGVIGPEFSSGTLQLILVKPINRATYLLSRVAGVVIVIWMAALVAMIAEAAGRMASGEVPWSALARMFLNAAAASVLTVSLLTLFGSMTRAYLNAAFYVVLSIGLSMLPAVLSFAGAPPSIARGVMLVDQNLYPAAPSGLHAQWLLMVLSNAAVALVLACWVFRNREVPYGAD